MAQYPRGVRVLKKLQNSNSATLTALDEMVSIMPNNTWLLAQLGEGYAMVRMPNESIQAFEKLRQVLPHRESKSSAKNEMELENQSLGGSKEVVPFAGARILCLQ